MKSYKCSYMTATKNIVEVNTVKQNNIMITFCTKTEIQKKPSNLSNKEICSIIQTASSCFPLKTIRFLLFCGGRGGGSIQFNQPFYSKKNLFSITSCEKVFFKVYFFKINIKMILTGHQERPAGRM